MALWVYNKCEKDFKLMWNGQEFLLEAKEWNLLPDDLVKAYFPSKKSIARLLPSNKENALIVLRGIIEVFLSRWGLQIYDYYSSSGDIELDIENFFNFIEEYFDISEIKPVKRTRVKKIEEEIEEEE